MVSLFQGLGLAAGSFSDVIEEGRIEKNRFYHNTKRGSDHIPYGEHGN